MNKKDYKILVDCLETRKRDNGDEFICKKDDTPKHIVDIIHDVMFENDNHDFDLDYKIMDSALIELSEVEFEDLAEYEVHESESEYASVYTGERLTYLNMWTQDEISDVAKEYSTEDIATACAIWYDNQVKTVIQQLIDKILA